MPEHVTIKLQGFDVLQRKLHELGPKVEKNGLRAANFAGAKVMVAAAEETAPVRTGTLKANIAAFRRGGTRYSVKHAVGVRGLTRKYANTKFNRRLRRVGRRYRLDGPAFYAKFLEFGTSKMKAQPFLRPAFFRSVDAIIEAIRDGLYDAIVKATR